MAIVDLGFEIMQVAQGYREKLSREPTATEWEEMFHFAYEQTLEGVMFSGIERLFSPTSGDGVIPMIPLDLKLGWFGEVQMIERTNIEMNRQAEELVKQLRQDGFECVVLKGQGIAQLYPEPLRRMSGDIDVWITSHSRDEVVKYLRSKRGNARVVYHNMPVDNWFEDTDVEVHFTPSWMNCWLTNRRLQRWFRQMAERSGKMEDMTLVTGERIPVPCVEFNLVFVLQHIYRHMFGSGIGLRQIMDYYYVLKKSFFDNTDITGTLRVLRKLHMMQFTSAVMWVLQEVMAMPKEWTLCEPDEREGRFLLSEILRAGNFGLFDDRITIPENESKIHSFFRITKQNLRLLGHYPEETLWNPAYRAWHYCWRKVKGYPI